MRFASCQTSGAACQAEFVEATWNHCIGDICGMTVPLESRSLMLHEHVVNQKGNLNFVSLLSLGLHSSRHQVLEVSGHPFDVLPRQSEYRAGMHFWQLCPLATSSLSRYYSYCVIFSRHELPRCHQLEPPLMQGYEEECIFQICCLLRSYH